MILLRESKGEDKEKIIRCANEAFGDSVPGGGFSALLPKLYGEDAHTEGNHLLAVENGSLSGLLLIEPMEYRVWEERMTAAGIGTAAVSPAARGRGIMKLLMAEAVKRMKEKGYSFAVLGGQRQRYGYWGFEPCGTQMYFEWEEANLKHGEADREGNFISIAPLAENEERIEQAFRLWEQTPVGVVRRKQDFYRILCSWGAKPYVCLHNGAFAGYMALQINTQADGMRTVHILELLLEDASQTKEVLYAIRDGLGISSGTVSVNEQNQEMLTQLEELCETERLECHHKFLVLDWKKVLQAMLVMKSHYCQLEDGEAVFRITEQGRAQLLKITVRDSQASVEDISQMEIPEKGLKVEMTAQRALRTLFRHTLRVQKELEGLPRGWFPLPLHINDQDCC